MKFLVASEQKNIEVVDVNLERDMQDQAITITFGETVRS